jgi:hypothetical protein
MADIKFKNRFQVSPKIHISYFRLYTKVIEIDRALYYSGGSLFEQKKV